MLFITAVLFKNVHKEALWMGSPIWPYKSHPVIRIFGYPCCIIRIFLHRIFTCSPSCVPLLVWFLFLHVPLQALAVSNQRTLTNPKHSIYLLVLRLIFWSLLKKFQNLNWCLWRLFIEERLKNFLELPELRPKTKIKLTCFCLSKTCSGSKSQSFEICLSAATNSVSPQTWIWTGRWHRKTNFSLKIYSGEICCSSRLIYAVHIMHIIWTSNS